MKNCSWGWVLCLACAMGYGCESDSVGSTHNSIRDICGNALVETGELCDDGNQADGDGCSADCKVIEKGYECPAKGGACKPDGTPIVVDEPVCGDGSIAEGEQCDDGNDVGGDGCSAECQIETGYECAVAGQSCEKTPVSGESCGNGQIDDNEDCDDGNTQDGDGCSSTCSIENGWECESQDCHTVCGDGVIVGPEVCDDWNALDGDGCSADCMTIEDGYTCITQDSSSYCVTEGCGNGVEEDGEQCDDGETSGQPDAKSYGWDKDINKPYCFMCKRADFCGDGKVSEKEQCDEGALDDEGNPTLLDSETQLPIGGDGTYGHCKPDCTWADRCGDGIVQEGETCDKGDNNDGSYGGCTSDCQLAPYCGDGIVQENEVCDDGLANNTGMYNHCKADCSGIAGYCGDGEKNGQELCDEGSNNGTVSYAGCTSECKFTAICGDGTVDEANGESCDEGMLDDNGRPTLVNASGTPIGGYGNYGGCTAGCAKAEYCGDGIKNGKEKCDDGNTDANDGCEANCMAITPKWQCKEDASGKSICSVIPCGNGTIDAGEQCDDGMNPAECLNCKVRSGFMCLTGSPACPACSATTTTACCSTTQYCRPISDLYGDGVLNPDFEKCDDGNTKDGDGCTQGKIDPGYICPTPGERCVAKACGDGIKAYGEECDDGNNADADGCSARCKREIGYRCDTPGSPCVAGTCGDGIVQYGEECDSAGGIGCDSHCKLVNGYECLADGGACQEVTCGDGNAVPSPGYVSSKECDDNNTKGGDGCSSACKIETGYHCDIVGTLSNCVEGRCNNGIRDAGEECDDGNALPNDGCSPSCKREIMFDEYVDDEGNVSYSPKCGDGITLWMIKDEHGKPVEECDDGNLISGDGCSSQCKIEPGFTCTDFAAEASAATIDLDITYYDFRSPNQSGKSGDGYLTQAFINQMIARDANCSNKVAGKSHNYCTISSSSSCVGRGYPDMECAFGGGSCTGMVETHLDADSKPVLKSPAAASSCTYNNVACGGSFYHWYRYTPNINRMIPSKLTMQRDATDLDKYSFASTSWYPLKEQGYYSSEPSGSGTNLAGNFTSELHTFFQYKGGEKLDFRGDDDVWAFINKTLFVDLGGMQSGVSKSGTLSNGTCNFINKDGVTVTVGCDSRYDIFENGVYELHFFQAERCSSGSQYTLTLDGFLKTGVSTCQSKCGDGIVAGDEQCDEVSENCENCKLKGCGDGNADPGEECDSAITTYPADKHCLNTCKWSSCGDGVVDPIMGEECEPSLDPECTPLCKLPACGDGIVNGSEECDDGTNDGSYNGCNADCTLAPACGDGVVQSEHEACDDGINNSNDAYNGCRLDCTKGPHCGDGEVNGLEECDDGTNDGAYGGCNANCTLAPYCGDGIKDEAFGEACDNGGANMDDVYKGCSLACTLNGYCGDGIVNGPEACDDGINDGSYNGCAANCLTKGPYCGDGKVNGSETCDDGVNNGAYGGCNADCSRAAYCGDGIVNGSEPCDPEDPATKASCSKTCTIIIN